MNPSTWTIIEKQTRKSCSNYRNRRPQNLKSIKPFDCFGNTHGCTYTVSPKNSGTKLNYITHLKINEFIHVNHLHRETLSGCTTIRICKCSGQIILRDRLKMFGISYLDRHNIVVKEVTARTTALITFTTTSTT